MAERTTTKPEIASQKLVIKLPAALGDWTAYRPPRLLVKKVKSGLYGFDRLSKEELGLALRIHYRFVEKLLTRLKIDLGMAVEFATCQIEQTTYLNFLRTLSGSVVQARLKLEEYHEPVQFILNLDLAHSLINHALGSRDLGPISQSLNETENGILLTALTEYLPKYVQSFDDIFADPDLTIVGSPDIVPDPAITPSATFVYFQAEVSFNDNPSGKIAFGYLASHLKTLLKVHEEKGKIKPLNFSRLTAVIMNTIKVPVLALLGRTNLLTSEIDQLEPGDVVALDSPINSTVSLRLGDLLKIMAEPGIRNRKRTVKIAGLTEEQLPVAPPVAVTPPPPSAKPAPLPVEEQPAEVATEAEPVEETEEEFTEEELFPEEEEFLEEETTTQGG